MEKNTYIKIENIFGNKIKDYGMMLERYDDENNQLYYKLGLCSLKEFIDFRRENNIRWHYQEIYYIFSRLIRFVLFFLKKDYFHGDIKPVNIVLSRKSNLMTNLEIFIIDFAGASNNWKSQSMITPVYFNSFKRKKYYFNQIPEFFSKEERLKNEIFTIVRLIQNLILNSDKNISQEIL